MMGTAGTSSSCGGSQTHENASRRFRSCVVSAAIRGLQWLLTALTSLVPIQWASIESAHKCEGKLKKEESAKLGSVKSGFRVCAPLDSEQNKNNKERNTRIRFLQEDDDHLRFTGIRIGLLKTWDRNFLAKERASSSCGRALFRVNSHFPSRQRLSVKR